jgi:Fe-S cluster assembly protein SufD
METIDNTTVAVSWDLTGDFILNERLRQHAADRFHNTPFPTSRTEAWKYTRLTKIKNATFKTQADPIELNGNYAIESGNLCFVFVNGHFAPHLSSQHLPNGLKIQALSKMDKAEVAVLGQAIDVEKDLFLALNTAYATDGLYIHVSAKMCIEPSIEIVQINTDTNILSNLRNFITVEAFGELKIIQRCISVNGTNNFTNAINEVHVAENAKLIIDNLQEEDASCFRIANDFVTQAKNSNFTINTITLNGGLVRNNLSIDVTGENCETHLNGAYILKDSQHVDNHTVVDHKVAHCESNELYKGVIDGKATAVFNGKVFVRKDAQKINAYQSNANVLLSESASVNSKPELEIYADDVKCSHGSTTGQLDDEAIFYLRARGISEASAKQLMVGAFIEDVLQKIENEAVLELIHQHIKERFNWEIG